MEGIKNRYIIQGKLLKADILFNKKYILQKNKQQKTKENKSISEYVKFETRKRKYLLKYLELCRIKYKIKKYI